MTFTKLTAITSANGDKIHINNSWVDGWSTNHKLVKCSEGTMMEKKGFLLSANWTFHFHRYSTE